MEKGKLPPIPKETFDGDNEVVTIENKPCPHYLIVKNFDIFCRDCGNGWPGLARHLTIQDGKVAS